MATVVRALRFLLVLLIAAAVLAAQAPVEKFRPTFRISWQPLDAARLGENVFAIGAGPTAPFVIHAAASEGFVALGVAPLEERPFEILASWIVFFAPLNSHWTVYGSAPLHPSLHGSAFRGQAAALNSDGAYAESAIVTVHVRTGHSPSLATH